MFKFFFHKILLNFKTLLQKKITSSQQAVLSIKPFVLNEYELNSLGYLLLKRHQSQEALTIFRINANLFPQSANVLSSLGEAYLTTGDKNKAITILEQCLELNPSTELRNDIIALLLKAKNE